MAFKLIDRQCDTCGFKEEYLKDTTLDEDKAGVWNCSHLECQGKMTECVAAPHIRTSETASRIDGLPRAGWDQLRREQAVELAKLDAPAPAENADIDKHASPSKIGDPL